MIAIILVEWQKQKPDWKGFRKKEERNRKKEDQTTLSRGQKDQSSSWQREWSDEKIFLRWEK